ncbi:MAG: hypothetical protein G01um101431_325 [Parcubacteria group bacterium Gr01-1014_31]|nr:MAG: hypothetical protein G01um101431_325 [Parcubacteria group bacterium Gr01-1014_31]
MRSSSPRLGFSLIELTAVIGIAVLLLLLTLPNYQTIRRTISVQNQATEVEETLRLAQIRALTAQDGTAHGVHFSTGQYVLFGGEWANPTYAVAHDLQQGVQVLSGAGVTVTFRRLAGTANAATIVIGLPGDNPKTIQVDATGKISAL